MSQKFSLSSLRIFTSTYKDAISQYYLKTLPCLPQPSIFCPVLCPLYIVCPHGVALTFCTVISLSLLSRIQSSFSFHPLSHVTTLNSTSDFHIITSSWHLVIFVPFDLSAEFEGHGIYTLKKFTCLFLHLNLLLPDHSFSYTLLGSLIQSMYF